MDSDRFLGQVDDDKGLAGQAAASEKSQAESSGLTGLFGSLPPEPPQVGAEQAATRPLPVVHSVVFKADSSRTEGTDQLMNILRSPALKAEAAPIPSLAPAATPPPVPSGGFTQLLRALNYEQVKEVAPELTKVNETAVPAQSPPAAGPPVTSFQAQPAAGASAASFTQLFESAAVPREPAKLENVPAPAPGSFTQMFKALDAAPGAPERESSQVAPETSAPVAASPVQSAAPGSFTQMFATASSPQIEPLSREAGPVAPSEPVITPALPKGPDPAPAPGPFTQMFQALDTTPTKVERTEAAPNAAPAPVAPPPITVASEAALSAGSFTQMFRALDAVPVETSKGDAGPLISPATPVPPPVAPGSFTQMFRALDTPPAVPVNSDAAPPSSSVAPLAAAQDAGSFTRMFRALDATPNDSARIEPPTQAPAAAPPGSFTQMFSTPSSPQLEETHAEQQSPMAQTPGSFTQMFRTPDADPIPADASIASAGPPNSGASQVFEVPRSRQEQARENPPFSPFENATRYPAQPSAPSTNASPGGLTQLLRALDQPSQAPSRSYAPSAAPQTAAAGGQQPGAFTAMYGTLREDAPSSPIPSPVPPGPLPQSEVGPAGQDAAQAFPVPQQGGLPRALAPGEAGPSEFTRILNASTLRESALRGGGQPDAGEAPATAPPLASAPASPQWAMPQAPKLPTAPQPPQAPKLPEVKLPEIAKAPAGGMQQYLPLLLILVIFLLLAILVAVIFLMKK